MARAISSFPVPVSPSSKTVESFGATVSIWPPACQNSTAKLEVRAAFYKLKKIRTIILVGAPGFEPGASCAQGRRATRLRYAPTPTTERLYGTSQHAWSVKLPKRCYDTSVELQRESRPQCNVPSSRSLFPRGEFVQFLIGGFDQLTGALLGYQALVNCLFE